MSIEWTDEDGELNVFVPTGTHHPECNPGCIGDSHFLDNTDVRPRRRWPPLGGDRHLWRGYGWNPSTNVCFTCGFTRSQVDRLRRNGDETRCRLLLASKLR